MPFAVLQILLPLAFKLAGLALWLLANEKRFHVQEEPAPLFYNRTQVNKAIAWRLASCSNDDVEQPLLARMTEFWFNHFNIYQQKGPVRPFAGHYAIHVARAHALGKFEDLVLASAKHPAMLYYLDQWLSVSPQSARAGQNSRGLNENYARELMELHTLGVQGGYTQYDVRELARIFTGWTVSPRSDSGFQFVFQLVHGVAQCLCVCAWKQSGQHFDTLHIGCLRHQFIAL